MVPLKEQWRNHLGINHRCADAQHGGLESVTRSMIVLSPDVASSMRLYWVAQQQTLTSMTCIGNLGILATLSLGGGTGFPLALDLRESSRDEEEAANFRVIAYGNCLGDTHGCLQSTMC